MKPEQKKYEGLRHLGNGCQFVGGALVVVAIVVSMGVLFRWYEKTTDMDAVSIFPWLQIGQCIGGAIAGLLFYAAGDLLDAVADIARDTTRTANVLEETFGDRNVVVEKPRAEKVAA